MKKCTFEHFHENLELVVLTCGHGAADDVEVYRGPIPADDAEWQPPHWLPGVVDDPYIGDMGRMFYEGDGKFVLYVYINEYDHEPKPSTRPIPTMSYLAQCEIHRALEAAGVEGDDLERAMNSRVCDLEDTIDVWKWSR